MGQRLQVLSEAMDEVQFVHGIAGPQDPWSGLPAADVVIDVSVQPQLQRTVSWCVESKTPLVVGTTGLSPSDQAALDSAARHIPVLVASNFSVGVQALLQAASVLAQLASRDFDIEVVEAHHRHKVDSPSGTARTLVAHLLDALGDARSASDASHHRPEGHVGPRSQDEIGVSVIRGGDVVGTHSVHFFGLGESVTLTHQATDRDIFVRGALLAGSRRPLALLGVIRCGMSSRARPNKGRW
jgi:4-hydroxy-tetrahydrodipicolinate reductase